MQGTNMETGEELVPPVEFWTSVVAKLQLTEEQVCCGAPLKGSEVRNVARITSGTAHAARLGPWSSILALVQGVTVPTPALTQVEDMHSIKNLHAHVLGGVSREIRALLVELSAMVEQVRACSCSSDIDPLPK